MASLPDLSHLVPVVVPTGSNRGVYPGRNRAFIYVVADRLGDEESTNDPLLLLVRHNYPAARNVFGVPGGLQDPDDLTDAGNLSLRVAAKREFAEEVFGLESDNTAAQRKEAVTQIIAMSDQNDLEELERTTETIDGQSHTTGLFRLRVPRTSVFEERVAQWNLAVNPTAGVDVKRITSLSSEMTGYAWVRKSAMEEAWRNGPVLNRWGNLQLRDTAGGTLSVRDMVLLRYWPASRTIDWQPVCRKLFDFETKFKTEY